MNKFLENKKLVMSTFLFLLLVILILLLVIFSGRTFNSDVSVATSTTSKYASLRTLTTEDSCEATEGNMWCSITSQCYPEEFFEDVNCFDGQNANEVKQQIEVIQTTGRLLNTGTIEPGNTCPTPASPGYGACVPSAACTPCAGFLESRGYTSGVGFNICHNNDKTGNDACLEYYQNNVLNKKQGDEQTPPTVPGDTNGDNVVSYSVRTNGRWKGVDPLELKEGETYTYRVALFNDGEGELTQIRQRVKFQTEYLEFVSGKVTAIRENGKVLTYEITQADILPTLLDGEYRVNFKNILEKVNKKSLKADQRVDLVVRFKALKNTNDKRFFVKNITNTRDITIRDNDKYKVVPVKSVIVDPIDPLPTE